MPPSTPSEYRFAQYRLRPGERALLAHDQPVKLGGRALDALLLLVEHSDRAVPKSELMERVWPKLVVEDNNLQVQIAALRKVLGPSAIVTIPGRGYRFTLPVEQTAASVPTKPEAVEDATPRLDNLPQLVGSLCGRDEDLVAVGALLDSHALVSIVGSAGIGKTRLALAVAHARRVAYADGVRLVELAPISDPARVAVEVARAIGLQTADGRTDVDAIAAALANHSALLVLDNCEHVLEAVAAVADGVSRRAPGVRMLVTSQEPLKVSAEHVYRLDPLSVPGVADATTAQRHGAVALFIERAQAADPRFRLDESNVNAVLEVCRRLDGIPLALELAAARVPLLGVEGLRVRLDERFNILSGGSRFVLRRHQTLRAALDFSYGLLDERERAVLRRAGVFAGSFALESAQLVCAGDALDAWEVLDCLGALVDKSLVVAETGPEPRLRLLETTRAYALEKLGEGGETAGLLERHAVAMAAAMRPMYEHYMELAPEAWLRRYEPELDNLRAAIAWSLRHAPARAIELVGDSLKLWQDLALQPEGRGYCAAALALLTPETPARAAGRLWYADAMLAANMWPLRSRDAARRAITLLRVCGDDIVLTLALARLAGWSRGAVSDEQQAALQELERRERPEWGGQMRWIVPYTQAMSHRGMRRFDEARRSFEQTLDISRELGDVHSELRHLVNIAEVAVMAGDTAEAVRIATEARRRLEKSHDQLFHMFSMTTLVYAHCIGGNGPAAREPLEAAVPLLLRYDIAYRFAEMGALFAALEGNLGAAARMLGYAERTEETREEFGPDPNAVTAGERARELLAGVPEEQLHVWLREGAGLSDEAAFRAVLRAGERTS